jgi:hypothetical protein
MLVADLLELDATRRDELLAAAGFWPAAYHRLGPDDSTLSALAGALVDPAIPEDVRAALRTQVDGLIALARRTIQGQLGSP